MPISTVSISILFGFATIVQVSDQIISIAKYISDKIVFIKTHIHVKSKV